MHKEEIFQNKTRNHSIEHSENMSYVIGVTIKPQADQTHLANLYTDYKRKAKVSFQQVHEDLL